MLPDILGGGHPPPLQAQDPPGTKHLIKFYVEQGQTVHKREQFEGNL